MSAGGAYVLGATPAMLDPNHGIGDNANYQWAPANLSLLAMVLEETCRRCSKSIATGRRCRQPAHKACASCTENKKGGCEPTSREFQGRVNKVQMLYDAYQDVVETPGRYDDDEEHWAAIQDTAQELFLAARILNRQLRSEEISARRQGQNLNPLKTTSKGTPRTSSGGLRKTSPVARSRTKKARQVSASEYKDYRKSKHYRHWKKEVARRRAVRGEDEQDEYSESVSSASEDDVSSSSADGEYLPDDPVESTKPKRKSLRKARDTSPTPRRGGHYVRELAAEEMDEPMMSGGLGDRRVHFLSDGEDENIHSTRRRLSFKDSPRRRRSSPVIEEIVARRTPRKARVAVAEGGSPTPAASSPAASPPAASPSAPPAPAPQVTPGGSRVFDALKTAGNLAVAGVTAYNAFRR